MLTYAVNHPDRTGAPKGVGGLGHERGVVGEGGVKRRWGYAGHLPLPTRQVAYCIFKSMCLIYVLQ
jgi:hypothetical protein